MATATAPRTDPAVERDVENELSWDPAIDAEDIDVAVDNGVVTMTGTVKTYAQKLMAERAVRDLNGVRAVANDLLVRTADTVTDKQIAQTVAAMIESNVLLKQQDINITVRNGIVILDGQVDWEYQRRSAEQTIQNVRGITTAINNIKVVPPAIAIKDVHKAIQQAFERNARLDASRILVEVNHGRVRLYGSVDTLDEKYNAGRAAWRAPGVTSVQNDLVVI